MRSQALVLSLLAHVAVLDEQVDAQEVELFRSVANKMQLTEEEQAQAERILADAADKLTLEQVVGALGGAANQRARAYALTAVLEMAYSDGYLDPREEHFVEQLVRAWQIPPTVIQELKLSLQQASAALIDEPAEQRVQSRFMATTGLRLLKGLRKAGVRHLDDRIEDLSNRLMLSGPDYSKAIAACARIARSDFEVAKAHLEGHWQGLSELHKQLDKVLAAIRGETAEESKQIQEAMGELKVQLQGLILGGMEESRRSLYNKQRAMSMFTISFLGKTKAGKSTLHAVVTGQGFEAIGKGKQRTTRLNRVYRWKQIRIVDTPGIEAPQEGGELDARIALSIVDESDVICFVLINDSQQTPELDVLRSIKDQNKPVVILLNVKENLSEPVRLKRFLENPEHWYTRQDAQALRGHVERIERYAKDRYKGGPVRVIPVQLLAARMSRQPEHAANAVLLFKGSRMQQFLDALRVSIIEEGVLRRSQTILDGTRYNLAKIGHLLQERTTFLGEAVRRLEGRRRQLAPQLDRTYRAQTDALSGELTGIFGQLRESVWEFAYRHYDDSESEIESAWERHLKRFELHQLVQGAAERAVTTYVNEVKENLAEVTADFQLLAAEMGKFDFTTDGTFSLKGVFKFLSLGLGALGAVLAFTGVGLVGALIVGLASALFNWVSGWFKSKEEKRREAAEKIRSSLLESVASMERQYREKTSEHLATVHKTAKQRVDRSLGTLANALQGLDNQVQPVLKGLASSCRALDQAYAYRLLQYAQHGNAVPEALLPQEIARLVQGVERDFGRRLTIKSPIRLSTKEQARLTEIIGEEITLVAGGK